MIGARLTFLVDARDVHATFAALQVALSAPGLAAFQRSQVVPYLQDRAQERFETEGDDAVGFWEPLSEATHEIRLNAGFPPDHPINRRTGELEDFITNSGGQISGSTFVSTLVWPEESSSRALQQKIAVAQEGRPSRYAPGGNRTPPRPVLAVNTVDMLSVLLRLRAYLDVAAGTTNALPTVA